MVSPSLRKRLTIAEQSKSSALGLASYRQSLNTPFAFLKSGAISYETCCKVAATLILAKWNEGVANGSIPLAEDPPNHRATHHFAVRTTQLDATPGGIQNPKASIPQPCPR